eukprot:UN01058
MEQKMSETVQKIIDRLQAISSVTVPSKDPEQERVHNTLKDTFNAFDKDGSAQLGFPEYVESWKFLDRPGSDADIKKAFDSVDIDKSGLIEWSEFAFSLMGEAALNFGPLAGDIFFLDLNSSLIGLKNSNIFDPELNNHAGIFFEIWNFLSTCSKIPHHSSPA